MSVTKITETIEITEKIKHCLISPDEDMRMLGFRLFCNLIKDLPIESLSKVFPCRMYTSSLKDVTCHNMEINKLFKNLSIPRYTQDLTLIDKDIKVALSIRMHTARAVLFIYHYKYIKTEREIKNFIFSADRVEYL